MKKSHQESQADFYQEQSELYEQLYATRNRTYGLKAEFAKNVIIQKGFSEGSLLEVGCGTGLFTQKLAEALPQLNILATDGYQPMIDIAQKRRQI